MSNQSPRILIADDHALIRDSLPLIMGESMPETTFGKASNSQEVLEQIEAEEWDIVILDLGLPGDREVETLTKIRTIRPSLPVLILSMLSEDKMGAISIQAGANGYLCKTADLNLIRIAVTEILAGRQYISWELAAKLTTAKNRPLGLKALSANETSVLLDLGRGLSVIEIADKMMVTDSSIEAYRSQILEKLELNNSADLIRYVTEHRLLDS